MPTNIGEAVIKATTWQEFNQQMGVQQVGHSSLKVHEPNRSLSLLFFFIFKNALSALSSDPGNTVNFTEKTKMYSQLL